VKDAGVEAATKRIAFSLHYGPQTVLPGEEGVTCLDVQGPPSDVWFDGFHSSTHLMHHVNVWKRTSGTPYKVPTKCDGGGSFGVGVFGVTQPETTEFFDAAPEYKGAAMQMLHNWDLIFDVHYLNESDTPNDASFHVDFFEAESHELEVTSYSFAAAKSLAVPPNTTKTLTYSCPGPSVEEKIIDT